MFSYPRIRKALTRYGFSTASALLLIKQAMRGDDHAMSVIREVRVTR